MVLTYIETLRQLIDHVLKFEVFGMMLVECSAVGHANFPANVLPPSSETWVPALVHEDRRRTRNRPNRRVGIRVGFAKKHAAERFHQKTPMTRSISSDTSLL